MNVIERLKAMESAASPAPWRECGHDKGGCTCAIVWSLPDDRPVMEGSRGDDEIPPNPKRVQDAALTATVRNLIPALLDLWETVNVPRVERYTPEGLKIALATEKLNALAKEILG